MAQIISVALLGVLIALAVVTWKGVPHQTGANPASLSISDIGAKVDPKSLPEQRIEDRTLVFGP